MEVESKYLNVLKGFLIILVVVGHFGQTIANNLPIGIAFIAQGSILFIYLFHMPLFLFVSGYLSKNVEEVRRNAFGNLFIPYVVYQLFVGISLLVLTKSGEALQNIFIPQMGAWYLLTLFCYRICLPEISKIRGVIIVGAVLSIFTCVFTGIGKEFALQKSLGFFVFFMAGYLISEIPRKIISRKFALLSLVVIWFSLIYISSKIDCYSIALSVLTRKATIDDFSCWYFAPIAYAAAFGLSVLTCMLILCAIPEKNKYLEKQGANTMPMYLSHLILFMGVAYLIPKNNWAVTVIISTACIIVSVILFSSKLYRKAFGSVLGIIKVGVIKNEE